MGVRLHSGLPLPLPPYAFEQALRLLEGAANPYGQELCLQPQIQRTPRFDAVAFQRPDGAVSVVAINNGEEALTFDLHDGTLGMGVEGVTIPPHAMQSFVLPSKLEVEDDLRDFFGPCGTITDCIVIRDKETGRSKLIASP